MSGLGLGLSIGVGGSGIPGGIYNPAEGLTYEEAFAAPVEVLRNWFELNTGPRIPLVQQVGNVVIASQEDADALSGVMVIGTVTITANIEELCDFGVRWDGSGTGKNLLQTSGGASAGWVHHFVLDGGDGNISYGFVGTSYSENILCEYGEIKRMGGDGLRTHKNSTYQYLYIHDFRAWDADRDGPWNPSGDQSLYPHTDGIQCFRDGNIVSCCFIENTNASNSTAALTIKPDADEAIVNFGLSESYLDGGGVIFYVDNQNSNIDSPGANGQPTGLVFENLRVGRNSRDDQVWRHDEVPSTSFTKGEILYADNGEEVEGMFVEDFNRANEQLEASANWARQSGVVGALTVDTNRVRSTSTTQSTYLFDHTNNGISDQNYSVETRWRGGSTTGWLIGRYQDEANYVGVQVLALKPTLYLKTTAGGFVVLGASPDNVAAGDKFRLEFRGQEVKFYHKNVLRASYTLPEGTFVNGRSALQARSTLANPMTDNYILRTLGIQ